MPSRKPAARAPAARTYQSKPRRLQRTFAEQRHHTRSTAAPPLPISLERQQTLTQLEFTPTPIIATEEERDVDSEEDFPDTRPKKKRRLTGSKGEDTSAKRQSTLTQIGFFHYSDDGEEDDEDELDRDLYEEPVFIGKEGQDATMKARSDYTASYPTEPLDPESIHRDEPAPPLPRLSRVIADSRASTESPPSLRKRNPRKDNGKSPATARIVAPSIPRTPQGRFKREIPSSQTPAATPISIHTQPTPSPSKAPSRVPLEEIPPNVLASRDSEPPADKLSQKHSSPKVKTIPRLRVADTFDNGEDSDEEWENHDPMEGPSPKSPQLGKDQGDEEEDEVGSADCQRKLDFKDFGPSKTHSSPRREFHIAAMPSQTPSPRPAREPSASPTPHRSAARSAHFPSFSPSQNHHNSSPPIRSSNLRPPPSSPALLLPRSSALKPSTNATIRSSQATTVDHTQPTPRQHTQHHQTQQSAHTVGSQPQLRRAPSAKFPPSPLRPLSRQSSTSFNPPSSPPLPPHYLPALPLLSSPNMDTQAMLERIGSASPLSSIQDSADIVTFSQVLREEEGEERVEGDPWLSD